MDLQPKELRSSHTNFHVYKKTIDNYDKLSKLYIGIYKTLILKKIHSFRISTLLFSLLANANIIRAVDPRKSQTNPIKTDNAMYLFIHITIVIQKKRKRATDSPTFVQ